jgi:hypothetical protein
MDEIGFFPSINSGNSEKTSQGGPADGYEGTPLRFADGLVTRIARTYRSSKLETLLETAELIAKITSFDVGQVVWWILCDEEPKPPTVEAMIHRAKARFISFPAFYSWATITIRTPDFTMRDLLAAYKVIRSKWDRTKRQKIKDVNKRAYDIVQAKGPPPKRLNSAYWEKIRGQLSREGYGPRSWRAFAKAYYAIEAEVLEVSCVGTSVGIRKSKANPN